MDFLDKIDYFSLMDDTFEDKCTCKRSGPADNLGEYMDYRSVGRFFDSLHTVIYMFWIKMLAHISYPFALMKFVLPIWWDDLWGIRDWPRNPYSAFGNLPKYD